MGAMKNLLIDLLNETAGDNAFAHDAIEWAITSGAIHTTGHKEKDIITIGLCYDTILESYRAANGDVAALNFLSSPSSVTGQPGETFSMPAVQSSLGTEGKRVASHRPRPHTPDVEPVWRAAFD